MENPAAENRNNQAQDEHPPEYTNGQLMRMAVVYEFLARALPTEGRDYRVIFKFPNPNDFSDVSVRLEPYTDLGKIWCDYCSEALLKANRA